MMNIKGWASGLAVAGSIYSSPPAEAHTLWINVTPDGSHHVVSSVGYGHLIPTDEVLTADWGVIELASYDLIDPNGARHDLGVPKFAAQPKREAGPGVTVQPVLDPSMRKIVVENAKSQGTYTLTATSAYYQLVHYLDKNGKEQHSELPVDQIRNLAKILDIRVEMNYMKAAFAVGKWTDVKPIGHVLEIVPLSDLSALQPGGTVRFRLLLDGKPYDPGHGEPPHLLAINSANGARFDLASELADGEGEFRLPMGGHWRIDAVIEGPKTQFQTFGKIPSDNVTIHLESTYAFYLRP